MEQKTANLIATIKRGTCGMAYTVPFLKWWKVQNDGPSIDIYDKRTSTMALVPIVADYIKTASKAEIENFMVDYATGLLEYQTYIEKIGFGPEDEIDLCKKHGEAVYATCFAFSLIQIREQKDGKLCCKNGFTDEILKDAFAAAESILSQTQRR